MTREEALRTISGFAGPIGPFQEPEEEDRREKIWATQTGPGVLDQILDLVTHPPSKGELKSVSTEDFEYELSRILSWIGENDPLALLTRMGPLLVDKNARRTIIEVIGGLGVTAGFSWLEPLAERSDLTEEEVVRLACAVGEIGGGTALALLDRIERATPPNRERVFSEIEIARVASRRKM